MIYGRFGNQITVVRLAVIADVKQIEGRKPDKIDRDAIKNGSYVVVSSRCTDGTERLEIYHQAYMKADGGLAEIRDAIDATTGAAS